MEIVGPAVGVDGTGFSEYMGQFDALLDTIGNERPLDPLTYRPIINVDADKGSKDGDGDDDDDDKNNSFSLFSNESSNSVLNLLKSRHNCHT